MKIFNNSGDTQTSPSSPKPIVIGLSVAKVGAYLFYSSCGQSPGEDWAAKVNQHHWMFCLNLAASPNSLIIWSFHGEMMACKTIGGQKWEHFPVIQSPPLHQGCCLTNSLYIHSKHLWRDLKTHQISRRLRCAQKECEKPPKSSCTKLVEPYARNSKL